MILKIPPGIKLDFSGQRFTVHYSLFGEGDASARAEDICFEQTVEFPADLLPEGDIRDKVVGRVESLEQVGERHFHASISYSIEITSMDLVQFINVLYGNISMAPDIRVERFDLPDGLLTAFKGPRFGLQGVRDLVGAQGRPLLSTAIKPMGLSSRQMAEMAYELALGGIELIKDDHGLADQIFAPFEERVSLVAEAVAKANRETGEYCLYMPNITAPADKIMARARFARQAGAGGMLVIPSLIGWDAMRMLADADDLALPIMSHPAFHSIYFQSKNMGLSAQALYGQLPRLAGADMTIFPNFIGRFPATREDCISVVNAATESMGKLKASFPTPGGGLTLDRLPDLTSVYGDDTIYLMGGGLHRGNSLVENCRAFRRLVTEKNRMNLSQP
jgi:ribulose-bisphosphate carboxylase large chain